MLPIDFTPFHTFIHHTQVQACLDACTGFVAVALHVDPKYGEVPEPLPTLSEEGKKSQAQMTPSFPANKLPRVYANVAYCPAFECCMDMSLEDLRKYITKYVCVKQPMISGNH